MRSCRNGEGVADMAPDVPWRQRMPIDSIKCAGLTRRAPVAAAAAVRSPMVSASDARHVQHQLSPPLLVSSQSAPQTPLSQRAHVPQVSRALLPSPRRHPRQPRPRAASRLASHRHSRVFVAHRAAPARSYSRMCEVVRTPEVFARLIGTCPRLAVRSARVLHARSLWAPSRSRPALRSRGPRDTRRCDDVGTGA